MRTYLQNKVVGYAILAAAILFFAVPFAYHKIGGPIENKYREPMPVAIEWVQAKFVNLDGGVQIRKMNSVQWVEADYHTIIEKGDTVRTGPRGTVRIVSSDGTIYTAKSDTAITLLGVANGGSKNSSR